MSLNSWLCKTVDKEGKGFVTILDIIAYSIWGIIVIGVAISFLIIVFASLSTMFSEIQQIPKTETYTLFAWLLKVWTIPFVTIMVSIILAFILFKISLIKVAKCPLKKEEQK